MNFKKTLIITFIIVAFVFAMSTAVFANNDEANFSDFCWNANFSDLNLDWVQVSNLILEFAENNPGLTEEQLEGQLKEYLKPLVLSGFIREQSLEIVPFNQGRRVPQSRNDMGPATRALYDPSGLIWQTHKRAAGVLGNGANQRWGDGQLVDGNGHAYRHVVWNMELVRRLGTANRGSIEIYTNAWIRDSNLTTVQTNMDRWNNGVGRDHPSTDLDLIPGEGMRMTRNGLLRRIVNGSLVPTNNQGELVRPFSKGHLYYLKNELMYTEK